MNNNKWINLNILTYTINKLKELINKKANMKHIHIASEITEETDMKFVTTSEKEKIHVIQTDGDGSSILYSDGTYKKASSANVIHDGIVADDTTYSSKKIDSDFSKKTHTHKEFDNLNADSHTHSNKNVLDDISLERFSSWDYKTQKIITAGQGDKFLTDDGTYKTIDGISNPINDNDSNSLTTTLSASKINSNISSAVNGVNESLALKLDNKVDSVTGKGLSTNDYTNGDKNKVALIEVTGKGSEFLARDGFYYPINNVGINNDIPTETTTYSGTEIDKRINDGIVNLVLPTQNDAPTMWKKNFHNVTSGQVLEMQTSFNFNINDAIIQVYKSIAGNSNVIKTINDFNENEKYNYYYNSDNIAFSNDYNGQAKIKDAYIIPVSINSEGYYESEVIKTRDYVDINRINIAMR
ncbi:hypothetical protein [Lachnoclostridium sp.]|uniref:hypothetical protein n=1 Tax=Lachnoclostridium sp. TaxID=2028282 RepID=UPI0028993F28|nr:hypothetical protein [Lachnoclostridium sp.]